MSTNPELSQSWKSIEAQPTDVRALRKEERNALIVSAVHLEEQWVILSRYGDDCWQLNGLPTNRSESHTYLDFRRVPAPFKAVTKAVMYRFLRKGRLGQPRPKGSTVINVLIQALYFLRYLHSLKINRFSAVTPIIFTNYVTLCREARKADGKPLKRNTLSSRFSAVEAFCELSQYTKDPLWVHPWPDTSAAALAGLKKRGPRSIQGCATPLMPDEVFCKLFEQSYIQVERGKALLDMRDTVTEASTTWKVAEGNFWRKRTLLLVSLGWEGGAATFNRALLDLRTACYVVLACTSGCRNHEIANVNSGSHHRTQDENGTIYHWMRSKSEKTEAGMHDWMIPEAAVLALRLMERWAKPYQVAIAEEITKRRRDNPLDPEIARAQLHRHALFLGKKTKSPVRTLSLAASNFYLKALAVESGLDWPLASHQFRRKFTNYVAHSRFGDLRYLRVHFAHWSMDMTLGYAMDERWGSHLDLDLYNEIQAELDDIKLGTVDGWLNDDLLAGGYGRALKKWQRDPSNLAIFKDHQSMIASIAQSTAIRSNGHAWCTADNDACVGNTVERTRCGDCNNAVIGRGHLGIYRQLYNNLKDLLDCHNIGHSGKVRVWRDMDRCRSVLMQLGYDPESEAV